MPTYICQRCKLPLSVDQSLEGLSNAQKRLLTTNYSPRPKSSLMGDLKAGTESLDTDDSTDASLIPPTMIVPEARKKTFREALDSSGGKPLIGNRGGIGNGSNHGKVDDGSFVMLDEDKEGKEKKDTGEKGKATPIPVSDTVSTLSNVFNIVSSKYEMDYPVCNDCAHTLIEEMSKRCDQMTKEKDTYVQFLKKLNAQNGPNRERCTKSLQELDKLKAEEAETLQQLEQAEKENSDLKHELQEVQEQLSELSIEEQKHYLKENLYEHELTQRVSELNRVKSLYESNMDQLDALRGINVFDDTFNISTQGLFGTINGLRLGSLDDVKVSWHEINAALGQLVLLLSVCLRILKLEIPEYVLIPMGSTSKIEKIERTQRNTDSRKTVLDLFSMGEFSIGNIFTHNKLDAGMVALVDVIRKIAAELKSIDSNNELPFKMTKDKVAGYNISPSARASNKEWTAACKYLLTNTKWILTFTAGVYQDQSSDGSAAA
ncbi:hypothetical protein FOA43_002268 [Brettanomyces nanus]|uniref:Autophagy-related protein 6 n=1 Tax=Eeniella nana TaxID=13502 RepID=A0A875RPE1_EENNA|nr:uncharacterized protein FOA43_002268 [Brettanomyces nanus]QPG74930.1 hypothetical protein FOA43_002268 [Brettanomyces nanus]